MALVQTPSSLAKNVQATVNASHIIAHVFAVVSAILVFVWAFHFGGGLALNSDNRNVLVNAHAVVMVLGFIIVMGEGMMVYKTVPLEKKKQKVIHSALQFVAFSFCMFGVYISYQFHKKSGIPHLYSMHAWKALMTIILFGLQWILGFLCFWYPRASERVRHVVVPLHAFSGFMIFLIAISAVETGFVQVGMDNPGENLLVNILGLFCFLFSAFVCLSIILPRGIAS